MIKKQKYDKKLTIRITSIENEEVSKLAKAAGKSVSRFLVESGLGKKIKLVAGRGEIDKDVLEKLAYEIRKTGINVNQIAHQLNVMQLQGGTIELKLIENVRLEVERAMRKVKELL